MIGGLIMEYTELCKIAYKYKTDKCPQVKHVYTPVYYNMFNDIRNDVKKVFEMGILGGASLRMWRDYFPNATIYGADILKDYTFKEDRIETFVCDETKKRDVKNLIKKIVKKYKTQIIAEIPYRKEILEAFSQGKPIEDENIRKIVEYLEG